MLSVRTFTEAGGHVVNEDSFSGRPHPDDERSLMVALADGMGGQAGGGRASDLAVRTTLEKAGEMSLEILMSHGWMDVMRQADSAVSADRQAGFTTLIGLAVHENELRGAACGDSAVLAIDGPGRVQELTKGQLKNPPVGTGEATFIPFASELVPPWKILLMSDGVWKYVGWERVQQLGKTLRSQGLIDALQQAARMKGSGKFQDDFTLIVIQDKD